MSYRRLAKIQREYLSFKLISDKTCSIDWKSLMNVNIVNICTFTAVVMTNNLEEEFAWMKYSIPMLRKCWFQF